MKTYNQNDFKLMPWKNGGGMTLELFKIPAFPDNEIDLRISIAKVEQSGPFSIFNGINRHLFLLSGKGFKLTFSDKVLFLKSPIDHITFQGEEKIDCELIDGPCEDFNVMINRNWGEAAIKIESIKKDGSFDFFNSGLNFIFNCQTKELTQLQDESFNQIVSEDTHFIIITIIKRPV
ncbi:MAG: HutD family protein [Bacteriovoracaceae bacterium]